MDNYEFDSLVHITKSNNRPDDFLNWYLSFRDKCERISFLNEDAFINLNWESEQDAFSCERMYRISNGEIRSRIDSLTDDDTRFRLNLWMNHEPAEIYSDVSVASMKEYIVFLFSNYSLAVFESFTPGNAYYTFRFDDFEKLLSQLSKMTKTQMLKYSNFVNRGYHIQNRDRLVDTIEALFSNS